MIPKIRLENLRGLIQTFFFRKKHAPSFEEKGVKESSTKWTKKMDQENLSHLVEKGLDSKDITDWWMNRY